MEEPYITTITLVIHEQMNTPATTKVQSSFCLLGSSFVFLLRSPLGITEVVDSLLLTRSKLGDLWLIAAVDISLVTIQLSKRTKGGVVAGVCAVVRGVREVMRVREEARIREVARASSVVLNFDLWASTHRLVECTDRCMETRIHPSGINPMGRVELSLGGREVDFSL